MQDPEATTTRKRRFRYTYVACEKCKARKSKCSGGQPCGRCRDANLICFYSRTTRFRLPRARTSLKASSHDVQDLTTNANENQPDPRLRHDELGSTFGTTLLPDATESSSVSGSSRNDSFDHCLRLAETHFAATNKENGSSFSPGRRTACFGSDQMRQAVAHRQSSPTRKVLGVFEVDSWVQILQIYEEEIGLQYPCIDIRHLVGRICQIKDELNQPEGHGDEATASMPPRDRNVHDIAFVILAIISAFVDPAATEISDPFVDEICGARMLNTHLRNVNLEDLKLLVLTCMFFFLSDREKQAWRVIGVVMRLLQELSSDYESSHGEPIPDSLFWTVYTLDRRWSFGTGLPFAIQDMDISRPPPSSNQGDLSSAYLSQMVVFCGIASEVRTSFLNNPSHCRSTLDAARDLVHFRVVQWQQNLPERLQFRGPQDRFNHTREKRGDYKLRLMLYFRGNLMRTIILRKSATRFGLGNLDEASAQSMAQVAHDTIRVLSFLVQDTDIYHAQHKTFNHFLETALSALLLVMCSGSDNNGNGVTAGLSLGPDKTTSYLKDIVEATELVQRLATCSPITRRLRDKLQGIQKFIHAMSSSASGNDVAPHGNEAPAVAMSSWDARISLNGAAKSSDDSLSPENQFIRQARSTNGSLENNGNASLGPSIQQVQEAAIDNMLGSDSYPVLSNTYTLQGLGDNAYAGKGSQALPSALAAYGPYMTMPERTGSESNEVLENNDINNGLFTSRMMEAALGDLNASVLSDLNDIMMDYDSLLF